MSKENTMQYNFLGNSGLKVSNICLGAMTFGTAAGGPMNFFENPKQMNEEQSHKLMDRYCELGGNFLDTANMYSYGKSEEIIGTWLKKQSRDDIVVATKVRSPMDLATGGKGPNKGGLTRRHIIQSCEASLERLQTDYIDLYQAHYWDNGTPLDETLRTFDDLTRCGKIRYYGYSNVCGWQMQDIVDTASQLGLNKCISLQQQYNLLSRGSEYEAFMVCRNKGLGVLPWSPLSSGLLTGKYKKDVTPDPKSNRLGFLNASKGPGSHAAMWEKSNNDEKYWNIIDLMDKIAKSKGKSIPQVALKWLLQKDIVSSVIIGATSIAQMEDNIGAAGEWELTADEMKELDQITEPDQPYPYDMLWRTRTIPHMHRYNRFNSSSVSF